MAKRVSGAGKKRLSRRTLALVLAAVCGISILTGILSFDSLPSIIGDNAEFMVLARALAEGEGFRYINLPDLRPATKYPPGFPAFLAGWGAIFGLSIVSMKVNILVCFVLATCMTFLVARKLTDDVLAALAALLVATSSAVVAYSHQVLSDIPYAFFSLLAIYILLASRKRGWVLALGIALCIWAYFVRTVGASLVLAGAIFLFRRKQKREALVLLGGFVLVSGLWAIRNYSLTGEGSRYMSVLLSANPYDPDKGAVTFGGLISRAWTNGTAYVGSLMPTNLLPTLVKPVRDFGAVPVTALVAVLVTTVTVLGGYALRRKASLTTVYILLYFAVYLGWPEVWRSERFMIPIAPILAVYFFAGIKWILGKFDVKGVAVYAVCGVLVLTNLIALKSYVGRVRGYPPGFVRYFDAATWVDEHAAPEAIVLCRKPFLFYVFSRRRTVAYPFTRDRLEMRKHLAEARPEYIVLEDFGGGSSATNVYLVPVLEELTQYLSVVHRTAEPVTTVLRFAPEDGLWNE
jgi:4-amino-4-deoxy-L-arabinose transferase-like glycosyltransferase